MKVEGKIDNFTTTKDDTESAVTSDLYIDPVAEKKLLWKLDLYIAPVMTLIFLTAYLDRSNIGNAATAGLQVDLKLKGNQLGSKLMDSHSIQKL